MTSAHIDSYINVSISLTSVLLFSILCYWIKWKNFIPSSVRPERRALWYNLLISLTHSSICTICCLYCFYVDPSLASARRLEKEGTFVARMTSAFSFGYFLYDFLYTVLYLKVSHSWGVLVHHVVVVTGYSIYSMYLQYYNFVIVALLCEVNSIFLHARQLLHLAGISSSTTVYRLNSIINVATHVTFRLGSFGWLMVYELLYSDIEYATDMRALIQKNGMIAMNILNLIILVQMVKRDFFTKAKPSKID